MDAVSSLELLDVELEIAWLSRGCPFLKEK